MGLGWVGLGLMAKKRKGFVGERARPGRHVGESMDFDPSETVERALALLQPKRRGKGKKRRGRRHKAHRPMAERDLNP